MAASQTQCDKMKEKMQQDQHQMKEQEAFVNRKSEELAKDEVRILEHQQKAELALAQAQPVPDKVNTSEDSKQHCPNTRNC